MTARRNGPVPGRFRPGPGATGAGAPGSARGGVTAALSPADCARCLEQRASYLEWLRAARYELEKTRAELERRAERLDAAVWDLTLVLEGGGPETAARSARRRPTRSPRRTDLYVSSVKAVRRADGSFDVKLDTLPPFNLSPLLGRLVQILAASGGHEPGDQLVGFKSNGFIMSKLDEFEALQREQPREGRRRGSLKQLIARLRKRLRTEVLHGDELVQTRRGVGFRFAVEKSEPPPAV